MKYLVLGSGGMAGHVISLYLAEKGHDVVGVARRKLPYMDNIVADVVDQGFLEKQMSQGGFDVVVNAVGVLNKNAEKNPSLAEEINGRLPHRIAKIAEGCSTKLIHLSTDCVFRGNTGPYYEYSKPDGETVYDRTKAMGEVSDCWNLTLRNSIVGPDVNSDGIGLFNWFMGQSGEISGFTNAIWTGLTTLELAKAIECASQEGSCGLVNMVPAESVSKYDLLQLFNEFFRSGSVSIVPDDRLALDKTLVRTNFECSFIPSDYRTQIQEMAKWVADHRHLYPHYRME